MNKKNILITLATVIIVATAYTQSIESNSGMSGMNHHSNQMLGAMSSSGGYSSGNSGMSGMSHHSNQMSGSMSISGMSHQSNQISGSMSS